MVTKKRKQRGKQIEDQKEKGPWGGKKRNPKVNGKRLRTRGGQRGSGPGCVPSREVDKHRHVGLLRNTEMAGSPAKLRVAFSVLPTKRRHG